MLIVILIDSIILILIGKDRIPFLNSSPAVNKALTLIGQFGLGFAIGFGVYTHGVDLMQGFWAGLAANVK